MNLSWIDWAIILAAVVGLRLVSLRTRHCVQGVSDFLSANRSAGRYLLTIAQQMGGVGAATIVAAFEVGYTAGLCPTWWQMMLIPASVIILLTGWVFYRFRETRAMTMAQFFEMRYSRRFRIFAGLLCWTSGILNFGIFPAVFARFFIHFCGLPDQFFVPGIPFGISTFATIMLLDLGLAVSFVMMGGQVAVMVTDCVQGMFTTIAFVIVGACILVQISWPEVVTALQMAPENQSMLNPFRTSKVEDFNIWFYMIALFGVFYGYMSWQGSSGFYSSARSPHEQKMGGIIAVWRSFPQWASIALLALAALVVMRLPEYTAQAAAVDAALKKIPSETIRGQMVVPVAMAHFLPVGVKGLLATIFVFFSFTCHDTMMHSWGSIFVQDVYIPIRNKALDPRQHIKFLKCSVIGVGVFAFVFSLLYPQTHKILMFQAITGTIWLGGSGAVIIGGLYWRRGTTPAAYASLTTGAILGVSGLVIPQIYKNHTGQAFPINGQVMWFIAMVTAMTLYIAVSLLTSRDKQGFNLERLLCRGSYAKTCTPLEEPPKVSKWQQIVGITPEFSRTDKILAYALISWNATFFLFFIVFSIINLMMPVGDSVWATVWYVRYAVLGMALSVPVTVWFTIGGIIDIRALFRTMATAVRDHSDDGRVKSEDELPAERAPVTELEEAVGKAEPAEEPAARAL